MDACHALRSLYGEPGNAVQGARSSSRSTRSVWNALGCAVGRSSSPRYECSGGDNCITEANGVTTGGRATEQPRLTNRGSSTRVDSMVVQSTEVPEDPVDALAAVGAMRRLADRVEAAAVSQAISDGWTWAQIAEALGVTRQAVHKKHARRVESARD